MKKYLFLIPMLILFVLGLILVDEVDNKKLRLNSELKNLSHFLLKGNDLGLEQEVVAVTKDGNIISIFKDDVYNLRYDFNESSLYLYYIKDDVGGIYVIDLTKDDYKPEILLKPIYNVSYIQVFNDNVYMHINNEIKVFNNGTRSLDIYLDKDTFIINKNKGLLLYNLNNNIYEYNLWLDKNNLLFDNSFIKFFSNNKLLLVENNNGLRLKEYDYDNDLVRILGNPSPNGTIIETHHNIFPKFNDYYILGSNNRINIIKKDKSIEFLTSINYNTDTITDLGNNKIFTFTPGYNNVKSIKRIYDLNDNSFVELDYIYSNPLYAY